jgi:hypothetical protein
VLLHDRSVFSDAATINPNDSIAIPTQITGAVLCTSQLRRTRFSVLANSTIVEMAVTVCVNGTVAAIDLAPSPGTFRFSFVDTPTLEVVVPAESVEYRQKRACLLGTLLGTVPPSTVPLIMLGTHL